MTRLHEIKEEIDRLSTRRAEVFRQLSEAHDAVLSREHQDLEDRIAQLWDEERIEKARLRFGERDDIIHRARVEERLSRAA
jgi:hypothetical protein